MKYLVSLALKRTYVVPIEAESYAAALAKAETIRTPSAACINREWRRIVSIEELDAAPQSREPSASGHE